MATLNNLQSFAWFCRAGAGVYGGLHPRVMHIGISRLPLPPKRSRSFLIRDGNESPAHAPPQRPRRSGESHRGKSKKEERIKKKQG